MSVRQELANMQWRRSAAPIENAGSLVGRLAQGIDAGLIATICAAPFFFGGRHDVGRLVFVALIAATAIAWFVRQSLLPQARWNRSAANGILLIVAMLVCMQIAPLPAAWIAWVSPRTTELLPLWTPNGDTPSLGSWNTLSLNPSATRLGLAMLFAYGLLFIVVVQRIANVDDVRRVLGWIGIAGGLMACFGIAQLLTSNGKYFWFYVHPYRTTEDVAMGSFMNRNHFASFLVMSVCPIVAWLVATLRATTSNSTRNRASEVSTKLRVTVLLATLLVVLMGIALSQSRGGALALVVAIGVLGITYWRWRLVDSKYLLGLAAIGLAMLGLLSVYGYDALANRLDDFAQGSVEAIDRDAARREIWIANLAAIRDGGLTGAGVGTHIDFAPIYLSQSDNQHYTHAENGYLQVASEAGYLGIGLLVATIGICGGWCVSCLRNLRTVPEQICFGGAVAGLAASLVHSLVDFVWYIPATMGTTLVLAACTLRLAQLSGPGESRVAFRPVLKRTRWLECTAAVTLMGAWSVYAYIGPARAAVPWDSYLRTEVAKNRNAKRQRLTAVDGEKVADEKLDEVLTENMVRYLVETLERNPNFATAHLELAQRYLDLFELRQKAAQNAVSVPQLAGAVAASHFDSIEAMRAWLDRAIGPNAVLLYRAHHHALQAVELCPLKGEAYVLLANLDFVGEGTGPPSERLAEQALRVRPRQASVLFEIGRQQLVEGRFEDAIRYWTQCANQPGPHQMQIVTTLAGEAMPASAYVKLLQPDWQTLRQIWARYRERGQPQDLVDLVLYAQQVTEREAAGDQHAGTAYLWLYQSEMYRDLQRPQESLMCLAKAYRLAPYVYAVRLATGRALLAAGRYAEAEPHVRWCLGRRPDNKELCRALDSIARHRYAQRTSESSQ